MDRVCFLLVVWIAAVCFAGKWSEWRNATLCTATKCNAVLKDGTKGEQVQFRHCERDDENDVTPCAYDRDGGPIRTIPCTAPPNETCSGWSNWMNKGDCECEPYKHTGTIELKRNCNNPLPSYGDRLCKSNSGEEVTEESTTETCNCTNIVTTTTTEKPERLRMCCCEEERLDGSSQPEPVTKETVFGRRRRQAGDSDYFWDCIKDEEDPNCCKSQEESTTAEKPAESQQNDYEYGK